MESTYARRIILALAAATASLAAAGPAQAATGDFTHILCASPEMRVGLASSDGLTALGNAPDWRPQLNGDCPFSDGVDAITLAPRAGGTVPAGAFAALRYDVQHAGLTLRSAELWRATEASGTSSGYLATGQHAATTDGDPFAAPGNPADQGGWLGGGLNRGTFTAPFAAANRVAAVTDDTHFTITAQCRPGDVSTTCTHAANQWRYTLFGARVVLRDAQPPNATDIAGSLATETTVTGQPAITFNATDAGAGLYRVRATVDGTPIHAVRVTGGDRCRDIATDNADPYEFGWQQPCPRTLHVEQSVSFAGVTEGRHRLRVTVEDAGGNEATLVDRDVTVDLHPAPSLADPDAGPEISGEARVGTDLTGTVGTWMDAAGYRYAWERCDVDGCAPIPGASGDIAEQFASPLTYRPTDADAGRQIRLTVAARNGVGEETGADSTPSSAVAAPPAPPAPDDEDRPGKGSSDSDSDSNSGDDDAPSSSAAPPASTVIAAPPPPPVAAIAAAPNGVNASPAARLTMATGSGRASIHRTRFAGATTIRGRLIDATSGRPIGRAALDLYARLGATEQHIARISTADDGSFTHTVRSAPSQTITATYRYRSTDALPAAQASVRRITPAEVALRVGRARAGRVTMLTGRLRHLPRPGVQVQVQALDGRRWRTFDLTKTRSGGAFRYAYRFKRAAIGRRFALRVLVDSPNYPFAGGASTPAWVRVRR